MTFPTNSGNPDTSGPSGAGPTSAPGPDLLSGSAQHPLLTAGNPPHSGSGLLPPTTIYPTYPSMAIEALNNPFIKPSRPSHAASYPPISSVETFRLALGPQFDPPTPPNPQSAEPSYRSNTDPFGYLTVALKEIFKSDLLGQGFVCTDFDLYNHYISKTYGTLSRGLHEQIWRREVPRLAISSPFLTHNILSTAAFHLAYTEQDEEKRKKWGADGSRHFNLAVTGIRKVLYEDSVTPENCHVVFCSSSLLFIGALADKGPVLASEGGQGITKGPSIHELVGVFRMVKGIGSVVNAQEAILREGPLGALFSAAPSPEQHPTMTILMQRLKGLLPHLPPANPADNPPPNPLSRGQTISVSRNTQIVITEIRAMIDSIEFALGNYETPEQNFIAVWPISMSEEFLNMLVKPETARPRQEEHELQPTTGPPPVYRNPVALALVGYYCCVMKETERECWFTKGWAEAIIKEVVADLEEMARTISTCAYSQPQPDQTVVNQHAKLREWVTQWLREVKWAEAWILKKGEEEPLPHPTKFSNAATVVANGPEMGTRGQQPVVPTPVATTMPDAPMMGTQGWPSGMNTSIPGASQGQQPGVLTPAPTPAVFSNSPMTGTPNQQPGAPQPAPTTSPQEDATMSEAQG